MIISLAGKISHTGLVEVPTGTPLREIIYDIGGGIPGDKKLKAVQIGGPWGGCIPADHIDVPVDHENLTALGSIRGPGGMVVMDEDTCMVDVARAFVSSCMGESSGQCAPCREGAREVGRLLDDITQGKGTPEHLAALDELCLTLGDPCLCGPGKPAPDPVLSTLRYFRLEYDAHIHDKRCPAGVCKPLISFSIDSSECMGCMLCAQNCPRKGITGDQGGRRFRALAREERKKAPTIEQAACIKCGTCFETCPFGAVKKA